MSIDRETLYQRLADGLATDAELDAARAELDGTSWATGHAVFAALAEVSDGLDVSGAVFAELGLAVHPVGDVIREVAGDVDVVAGVFAEIDLERAPDLRGALLEAAGRVDVSHAVLHALDLRSEALGDVVREAAGPVQVADAVMASLAPQVHHLAPTVHRAAPAPLAPANNAKRWLTTVALAAAALLVAGGGSWMRGATAVIEAPLAAIGFAPDEALVFASAAEVQIEDLSFGDDVVVFQDEGADGALILWVDEEVL